MSGILTHRKRRRTEPKGLRTQEPWLPEGTQHPEPGMPERSAKTVSLWY